MKPHCWRPPAARSLTALSVPFAAPGRPATPSLLAAKRPGLGLPAGGGLPSFLPSRAPPPLTSASSCSRIQLPGDFPGQVGGLPGGPASECQAGWPSLPPTLSQHLPVPAPQRSPLRPPPHPSPQHLQPACHRRGAKPSDQTGRKEPRSAQPSCWVGVPWPAPPARHG